MMGELRARLLILVMVSALAYNFSFPLSVSAQANQTVLYDFTCGTDGCHPIGNLARDSQGNLYGTTIDGGDSGCNEGTGCGVVFELSPMSGGGWNQTVIHTFIGGTDGSLPYSGVIIDASGDLYGVTFQGGTGSNCNNSSSGCGTVFKLTHSGSTWNESLIYTFAGGNDGANPMGGLVFDTAGNLYGTTEFGGTYSDGNVFELSPTSSGWNESVLHSFSFGDGYSPNTKLAFDSLGSLYGTTPLGGSYGDGTVFRLVPSPSGWVETTIWNFTPITGGAFPNGVIVHGNALYGTTASGGAFNVGNVFQLKPAIGIWTYTQLWDFSGGRDGGEPAAGLTADPDHLYGTTFFGGRYGFGTVFRLRQNSGVWIEDVLYSFTNNADGENPDSPLLLGPEGLFGFANDSLGGLAYEITAP